MNLSYFVALLSLGAVPPVAAPAAEFVLNVSPEAAAPLAEDRLELVLLDSAGGARTWPARIGEAAHLGLTAGGGPWRLGCRGLLSWCPTILVQDATPSADLALPVYPASAATGELLAPAGEKGPDRIRVQGWLHSKAGAKALELQIETTVEEGRFDLWLPQGLLDLRIAAEGWVPIYRWGWVAGPGASSLGRLHLRRGGSLAGFARDAEIGLPAAKAEMRLSPMTVQIVGREGKEERERLDRIQLAAEVDADGFFQLTDLAPGRYRLKGEREGLASYSLEVEVETDAETFVDEIILSPLPSLEVRLSPPLGPGGKPWLLRLLDLRNKDDGDRETATDEAGRAFFAYLDPAEYLLFVHAEPGRVAHRETLRIEEDLSLPIALPLLPLAGRISLGGEPLAASLDVGTGKGEKWPFKSDEEGLFTGWVRRPEHGLLIVEVASEEPSFKRELFLEDDVWEVRDGVLELEIELASNAVAGKVVDSLGQGVEGAAVRVWRGGSIEGKAKTDAEGAFRIPALLTGQVEVLAEHPRMGGSSAEMLTVPTEGAARVTLVLDQGREISGILLSADGQPVVGADIGARTAYPRPASERATSDLEGRFRLRGLPVGSPWIQVVVRAPSLMYWSDCLRLEEEELVLRLPPGPGGVVLLEQEYLPDGPVIHRGSPTVVRRGGSALSTSQQYAWRQRLGGDPSFEEPREGLVVSRLPAMAPGWYAVLRTDEPWWRLAEKVCQGELPLDLDWQYLGPGGTVTGNLDRRALQREKGRSRTRENP